MHAEGGWEANFMFVFEVRGDPWRFQYNYTLTPMFHHLFNFTTRI